MYPALLCSDVMHGLDLAGHRCGPNLDAAIALLQHLGLQFSRPCAGCQERRLSNGGGEPVAKSVEAPGGEAARLGSGQQCGNTRQLTPSPAIPHFLTNFAPLNPLPNAVADCKHRIQKSSLARSICGAVKKASLLSAPGSKTGEQQVGKEFSSMHSYSPRGHVACRPYKLSDPWEGPNLSS